MYQVKSQNNFHTKAQKEIFLRQNFYASPTPNPLFQNLFFFNSKIKKVGQKGKDKEVREVLKIYLQQNKTTLSGKLIPIISQWNLLCSFVLSPANSLGILRHYSPIVTTVFVIYLDKFQNKRNDSHTLQNPKTCRKKIEPCFKLQKGCHWRTTY